MSIGLVATCSTSTNCTVDIVGWSVDLTLNGQRSVVADRSNVFMVWCMGIICMAKVRQI
jgi:hypothetical protein